MNIFFDIISFFVIFSVVVGEVGSCILYIFVVIEIDLYMCIMFSLLISVMFMLNFVVLSVWYFKLLMYLNDIILFFLIFMKYVIVFIISVYC